MWINIFRACDMLSDGCRVFWLFVYLLYLLDEILSFLHTVMRFFFVHYKKHFVRDWFKHTPECVM